MPFATFPTRIDLIGWVIILNPLCQRSVNPIKMHADRVMLSVQYFHFSGVWRYKMTFFHKTKHTSNTEMTTFRSSRLRAAREVSYSEFIGPVKDKAETSVEGNCGWNILLLLNCPKLNGQNLKPHLIGFDVVNQMVSSNILLEVGFCEPKSAKVESQFSENRHLVKIHDIFLWIENAVTHILDLFISHKSAGKKIWMLTWCFPPSLARG